MIYYRFGIMFMMLNSFLHITSLLFFRKHMSDSDSSDTKSRVRYKTTSTRTPIECKYSGSSHEEVFNRDIIKPIDRQIRYDRSRSNSRSREQRIRYDRPRSRSQSRERTERRIRKQRSRTRSRSRERKRTYEYISQSSRRRQRSRSREEDSIKNYYQKREYKSENTRRRRSHSSEPSKRYEIRSPKISSSNPDIKKMGRENVQSRSSSKSLSTTSADTIPEVSKNNTENKECMSNSKSLLIPSVDTPAKAEGSSKIGPALPGVEIVPSKQDNREANTPESDSFFGPALPSYLLKKKEESSPKTIGPALPSHFVQMPIMDELEVNDLPNDTSDTESEDTDFMIGPLPTGINPKLEERALQIKLEKLKDPSETNQKTNAREEWMLELPDIKTITDLGLGARQFRTKERPDFSDRTSWTDKPADKEKKKDCPNSSKTLEISKEEEARRTLIARRDKQQEEAANKHKKKHKRDKSLVEIHEKKLKKERVRNNLSLIYI